MPVGALRGIQEIGRVGHDQVEATGRLAQQVATRQGQVTDPRQRRVDPRQVERRRIDIQPVYFGVRAGHGDADRAGAGAAADIRRTADACRIGRCQVAADQPVEAVGVGAEEHRVGGQGREGRMDEQLLAEAGDAHLAAPAVRLAADQVGAGKKGQPVGRQAFPGECPAPAEDAGQVPGHAVFRAGVDALMGSRGDGDETVVLASQPVAEADQDVQARIIQAGHGRPSSAG